MLLKNIKWFWIVYMCVCINKKKLQILEKNIQMYLHKIFVCDLYILNCNIITLNLGLFEVLVKSKYI